MDLVNCPDCKKHLFSISPGPKGKEITLEIHCPECKYFTCAVETNDAYTLRFDGIIPKIDKLKTRRPSRSDYSSQLQEEALHPGGKG